jgi:hypothetical protein
MIWYRVIRYGEPNTMIISDTPIHMGECIQIEKILYQVDTIRHYTHKYLKYEDEFKVEHPYLFVSSVRKLTDEELKLG